MYPATQDASYKPFEFVLELVAKEGGPCKVLLSLSLALLLPKPPLSPPPGDKHACKQACMRSINFMLCGSFSTTVADRCPTTLPEVSGTALGRHHLSLYVTRCMPCPHHELCLRHAPMQFLLLLLLVMPTQWTPFTCCTASPLQRRLTG
jgi:hypothetical protein